MTDVKKRGIQTIDVTCAIIINNKGEVLVTQRSLSMSLPLKWEFPGGKIEANETAEDCLLREIKEELNIEIKIIRSLPNNRHNYPSASINLIPFICDYVNGTLNLLEHANFKWLEKKDLLNLDWAEADIPILHNYLSQV